MLTEKKNLIITTMELRNQIQINAPKDFVASCLRKSENFDKWQDDFQSATLINGDKDQKGTKTRMLYKFGKSDMELIETIRRNDLPHFFEALYEHRHIDNTMLSALEDAGDDKTVYSTVVNYIEMKGLMIKIMAKLFFGKFKKGPEKWMHQFKIFVELEYQKSIG